ncbi:MAG TPA: hypothetical protein DCZ72_09635 [Armatimonadetes bacterium]|nr:hypothetical protein [Armatimonadota bacterium]
MDGWLGKVAVAMIVAYVWHRVSVGATGGGCPLTCSPWRALALGLAFGLMWAWSSRPPLAVGQSMAAPLAQLASNEETNMSEPMELTSGVPVVVNEAEFAKAIKTADRPVVLDVFATWCGPCKMLAPELEKVAAELGDRAYVLKVDSDASPRVAQMLGVRGVPALFVIKGDAIVERWAGFSPAADIMARVQRHLEPVAASPSAG